MYVVHTIAELAGVTDISEHFEKISRTFVILNYSALLALGSRNYSGNVQHNKACIQETHK